jgi:hypothetical protein
MNTTFLLASITLEGMGPSLAVEGSTTAEVLEAYLEQVLLPELCRRVRWWSWTACQHTRELG